MVIGVTVGTFGLLGWIRLSHSDNV